jgi:hypothetical protein
MRIAWPRLDTPARAERRRVGDAQQLVRERRVALERVSIAASATDGSSTRFISRTTGHLLDPELAVRHHLRAAVEVALEQRVAERRHWSRTSAVSTRSASSPHAVRLQLRDRAAQLGLDWSSTSILTTLARRSSGS